MSFLTIIPASSPVHVLSFQVQGALFPPSPLPAPPLSALPRSDTPPARCCSAAGREGRGGRPPAERAHRLRPEAGGGPESRRRRVGARPPARRRAPAARAERAPRPRARALQEGEPRRRVPGAPQGALLDGRRRRHGAPVVRAPGRRPARPARAHTSASQTARGALRRPNKGHGVGIVETDDDE